MKVYYLTKKKLFQGMIGGTLILVAVFLIISYLYCNIAVPTTEVSPIYQGDGGKKQISFAVNVDWGEEYIPDMIKIFNQHQIKCTFFLTGLWTERCPEIAKSLAENGQEIGNHGYKHVSPNSMSLEAVKADIQKSEKAIKLATGKETRLYAPPSGEREDHVIEAAHALGYQTILWSIDTIDWRRPAPDTIVTRILDKAHNGAIVLMHPTEPTIQALPVIIPELKKQGFKFVTVSENILQKEIGKDEDQ